MPKLKIGQLPGIEVEMFRKHYARGVRPLTLRKLLVLWFAAIYSRDFPYARVLEKRLALGHLPSSAENRARAMKAEEVAEILGCSDRTAWDYIRTLRTIL